MSRRNSTEKIRVGLQLSTSVPLEAMVVLRLHQLAKSRRNDWLRSLVVRGFINECEELRQLNGEALHHKSIPGVATPLRVVTPSSHATPKSETNPATPADKPLTLSALKGVVG